MMKRNLNLIAQRVGSAFAREVGYDERSSGIYTKRCGAHNRLFFLDQTVTRGVGELTLHVAVEIPSLQTLVDLFPGLESMSQPSFGGPAFRFADLNGAELHDFIIKVSPSDSDEQIVTQLATIWDKTARHFFESLRTTEHWLAVVDRFLTSNKVGPLNIPTIGRICIALKHASGGDSDEVLAVLATRGANGRPVQDFEQAAQLQSRLIESPELLTDLRKALLTSV